MGIALGVGLLGAAVLVYELLTWPDVERLASENPETTAFIERYRERRRAAGENDAVAWRWASWDRISPHLKRAAVAAEDMEFFSHNGFSTAELRAAIAEALEERTAPRGASTITQQLAKNLWLSPSRSPLRKLEEAILTWQLERYLSKDRILELYLNVAEFGPGIYGAEAAARHYYGGSAAGLTEHEAAQLAASLPRPSTWHPGRDSGSYRRYVAEIRRRMDRATFLVRRVGGVAPLPDLASDSLPAVQVNLDSLLEGDSAAAADTLDARDTLPQPPGADSLAPEDSSGGRR